MPAPDAVTRELEVLPQWPVAAFNITGLREDESLPPDQASEQASWDA
jgi:hypothetical protein